MTLTRVNEELSGSYFYQMTRESTGAIQAIILNGKIREDGTFSLDEFATEGKPTGTFNGKLVNETEHGETILNASGTWSKTGDSTELHFSLSEKRITLGNDFKLKSEQHQEKNDTLKYSYEISFPQLEGDGRTTKFNEAVRALVAQEVPEFGRDSKGIAPDRPSDEDLIQSDSELGYEVTGANGSAISVIFYISGFTEGAAHGYHNTKVINYDLKAGKTLEFGDLFKRSSNYLNVVSGYCMASLAKRDIGDANWRLEGAGPKLENFKSWNMFPGGLLITFDEYQVASYADGPQEVFIPFAVLKDIVNPTGSAASLMSSN